jgi:glycine/D-amino acid oxidase-like deaminating enzyme
MMASTTVIGRHAVVIGAGMGGLAAAGALAKFFDHVVVLERDELAAGAVNRQGTPQGRHNHALLAGGQQAFDALFLGFEENLRLRTRAICFQLSKCFVEPFVCHFGLLRIFREQL